MTSPTAPLLDRATIDVPCTQDWNAMRGDDRTRFCGACKLHVHDISALTRSEAESLLANRGERLCVRLYRRPDGTIITQDCRTVLARARRRMKILAAAVVGALGLTAATAVAAIPDPAPTGQTVGVQSSWSRLWRGIRNTLAPPAPSPVMGEMCPPITGKIAVGPAPAPVPVQDPEPLMGEMVIQEMGDVLVPEDLPRDAGGR